MSYFGLYIDIMMEIYLKYLNSQVSFERYTSLLRWDIMTQKMKLLSSGTGKI